MKCANCKETMKYRKTKRFCSHSCRASFHLSMKRLKSKKIDFTKKLEEAKNLPSEYPQEVLELFNKLREGGKYGV